MVKIKEDIVLSKLTNIFHSIKLRPNLNGYDYLVEAVKRRYYNESYKNKIYSNLYDDIADYFSTTKTGVEKEIRYVLEVTWTKEYSYLQYILYGDIISKDKGKPTSVKFIERTVEILTETFKQ